MATKTFSSRVDERKLAYADSVARERFGMSFGQYCGSALIEAVVQGAELPDARHEGRQSRRASAIGRLKALSARPHDEAIGRMSDAQIRDLIASRYE